MSVLKEEFKQLHKSYKKQLQQLQKGSFDTPAMWLDYFVSYLKFLRDSLILEEPLILENDEENLKIASIATAITAYEKYKINLDLCNAIAKNSEENKALINKGAIPWDKKATKRQVYINSKQTPVQEPNFIEKIKIQQNSH
jgi:hypothetical protein